MFLFLVTKYTNWSLVKYLETVWWIQVQLIWEISHSSFIGHCCLRHGWTFGQLEEPVGPWSVADITCETKSWLSCRMIFTHVFKVKSYPLFFLHYLPLPWDHCCRSQCGLLRQDVECWNLCYGPTQLGLAKTKRHPFLHLTPKRRKPQWMHSVYHR